jgi:NADPH2:quinone reductase
VVAAAGGERKLDFARELGADHVVDYTQDDWAERVRAAVGAVDVVFDGVGGAIAATAFDLLADGGRMVSFGMASGTWAGTDEATATERGVALLRPRVAPNEMRVMTESALDEASAGRLRPVIGQRFPLEQAAAAHAAIEARTTVGKTLLIV